MNTYKDDPGRGLSKLQRAMLVWLFEMHQAQPEHSKAYGVFWSNRPTFYGRPVSLLFKTKSRFRRGETPAVARALKSLEQRGLIRRFCGWMYLDENSLYPVPVTGGRTKYVLLTDSGLRAAVDLISKGATSFYQDNHEKDLAENYAFLRNLKATMALKKESETA